MFEPRAGSIDGEVMNKSLVLSSVLVTSLVSSSFAFAEGPKKGGYMGLNYSAAPLDIDGIDDELDLGALVAKAGAQITPYVAAEFRAGFGVQDDELTAGVVSFKSELDYLVGAYMLLGLPNSSPVYPYAVVGASKAEFTFELSDGFSTLSGSDSETGLSYGVGANIEISDEVLINGEYIQYFDEEDFELSGINVGATFRF